VVETPQQTPGALGPATGDRGNGPRKAPLDGPPGRLEAPRPRPGSEWMLVLLFLAGIWLPRLDMTFHLFPSVDTHENRRPGVAPTLSARGLSGYLGDYGRYFTDNFGLRGALIRADNTIRLKFLRSSPVSRLIFGRDAWIFYNSDVVPDGITIRDFKGLATYSAAELKVIRGNLDRCSRWCRARRIACVFVIAPNKETIYPEYLPSFIRKIGDKTRLDQVVEAVRSDSTIRLLDLRRTLWEAKSRCPYPLYSRGGTHWNQYGAFYAYRAIASELARTYPRVRAHDFEDYDVVVDRESSEDHWLGLEENTAFRFSLKEQGAGSPDHGKIGKVVVMYDSFWNPLEPFFTPHFDAIIQERVDRDRDIVRALLERERPDVVIYEMAERSADRVWKQIGF
jgi:hypothetical protein